MSIALPSAQPTRSQLYAPRGVLLDAGPDGATRLVAADTGNHRLLVWPQLPDADGADSAVVVGQPDATSEGAQAGGPRPRARACTCRPGWPGPATCCSSPTAGTTASSGSTRRSARDDPAPVWVLGQNGFGEVEANRGRRARRRVVLLAVRRRCGRTGGSGSPTPATGGCWPGTACPVSTGRRATGPPTSCSASGRCTSAGENRDGARRPGHLPLAAPARRHRRGAVGRGRGQPPRPRLAPARRRRPARRPRPRPARLHDRARAAARPAGPGLPAVPVRAGGDRRRARRRRHREQPDPRAGRRPRGRGRPASPSPGPRRRRSSGRTRSRGRGRTAGSR